jgi:hypothetical protein
MPIIQENSKERILMRSLIASLVIFSWTLGASAQQANLPPLNKTMLEFAQKSVGKKIGNGECTTLAIEGLKAGGAKTTYDYGVSGLDKDYVWGKLVEKFEDVLPGDIIQFRDVIVVSKDVVRKGNMTFSTTSTSTIEHHTAIIAKNLGGGKFALLDQNRGTAQDTEEQRRRVQASEIDLNKKTQGKLWIYRPQPVK